MTRFSQIASIGIVAGAIVSVAGAPASAASFSFGNDGIQFAQDTTVTFEFLQSNGKFKSSLFVGLVEGNTFLKDSATLLFKEEKRSDNGSANDWLGTPGNTVKTFVATYTFLADQLYSLALDSGSDGVVYSLNSLNVGSKNPDQQQALFTGVAPGQFIINFDDTGFNNDRDFNDFKISAAMTPIPEPSLLIGLGVAALGGVVARRRQDSVA